MQWLDGIFHARTGKCVFGQMLRVCPWIIHRICNDSWALGWRSACAAVGGLVSAQLTWESHWILICSLKNYRGWLVKQVELDPLDYGCVQVFTQRVDNSGFWLFEKNVRTHLEFELKKQKKKTSQNKNIEIYFADTAIQKLRIVSF